MDVQVVLKMATPHREPLGIREYSHSRARALLCPFSVTICCLSTSVEIAFERWPHAIYFLDTQENSPFLHVDAKRKRGCRHPNGEVMWSLRKPRVAGAAQALASSHYRWRSVGLPCFFYGIRESIEILVRPSFCLLPGHMVLSLVSYFYFYFFLNFFFWGIKLAI